MHYEVEKGVPLPPRRKPGPGRNSKGFRPKYPWDEMEVGDSFFVPTAPSRRIYAAAYVRNRKGRGRFVVRIMHGGARVWRVE